MINAWRAQVDDRLLAMILDQEGYTPSPRDWFVATSVVQWLATNVGMNVIERAGFVYKHEGASVRLPNEPGHDKPVGT